MAPTESDRLDGLGRSAPTAAVIVVVTGPPGTGKSTVAESLATTLGATLLAWDWLAAGLDQVASARKALAAIHRPDYRDAGWAALWNLGELQLRVGGSVVFDGVAREPQLQRARLLGAAHGATVFSVLTRCSDRALHEERIAARRRDIPGWHDLDWSYVERFLGEWVEPSTDVIVDSADPLDASLAGVHAALAARRALRQGRADQIDSARRKPIA